MPAGICEMLQLELTDLAVLGADLESWASRRKSLRRR